MSIQQQILTNTKLLLDIAWGKSGNTHTVVQALAARDQALKEKADAIASIRAAKTKYIERVTELQNSLAVAHNEIYDLNWKICARNWEQRWNALPQDDKDIKQRLVAESIQFRNERYDAQARANTAMRANADLVLLAENLRHLMNAQELATLTAMKSKL